MKQLTKKEIKKFFKKHPKRGKEIVLVLENLQYTRNTAAIFRTADAAGVDKIYLTGITAVPPFKKSYYRVSRGKENTVSWESDEDPQATIQELKKQGYLIIAIELTNKSIPLGNLKSLTHKVDKVCFIAGNEVYGINKKTLALCDAAVYIPMYGKGASLNVMTSVGIVLYSI
jgi:23S rRNA (guanosine2251-2'-O)-methyltransferase